jgi:hypothetical protein
MLNKNNKLHKFNTKQNIMLWKYTIKDYFSGIPETSQKNHATFQDCSERKTRNDVTLDISGRRKKIFPKQKRRYVILQDYHVSKKFIILYTHPTTKNFAKFVNKNFGLS